MLAKFKRKITAKLLVRNAQHIVIAEELLIGLLQFQLELSSLLLSSLLQQTSTTTIAAAVTAAADIAAACQAAAAAAAAFLITSQFILEELNFELF